MLKTLIKKIIQFTDWASSGLFYKNLLASFTKPGFIFLTISFGMSPTLIILMEILEKGGVLEEIVEEEIEKKVLENEQKKFENFEQGEQQETLREEEKSKKLNNAFWIGLAFFTILKVVVKIIISQ